jgi:hypothetical protein
MSHRMRFQSLDRTCPSQLSEAMNVSVQSCKEQVALVMHDTPAICGCGRGDGWTSKSAMSLSASPISAGQVLMLCDSNPCSGEKDSSFSINEAQAVSAQLQLVPSPISFGIVILHLFNVSSTWSA